MISTGFSPRPVRLDFSLFLFDVTVNEIALLPDRIKKFAFSFLFSYTEG
jgi:hypothetical protein